MKKQNQYCILATTEEIALMVYALRADATINTPAKHRLHCRNLQKKLAGLLG